MVCLGGCGDCGEPCILIDNLLEVGDNTEAFVIMTVVLGEQGCFDFFS